MNSNNRMYWSIILNDDPARFTELCDSIEELDWTKHFVFWSSSVIHHPMAKSLGALVHPYELL